MTVPFLDLKLQYQSIKPEIDAAIQQVIDNSAFILGKAVSEFETKFASAHSVKHCLGVSSGTDGNHLALWALGIKPGDEVIIPANTFVATAWGATLCGATPVFVDCESEGYNIDKNKIEIKIKKGKTKAIVAVHLYGQPADLDPLAEIAKKHNLHLIEDAAQAHLAEYKGKRVGGIGKVASFSFYPGKNLGAFGEGGAVTTNNDDLAKLIKMYREHGQSEKYHHEVLGHNYRMEGIQGAVLGVKMKYLDEWTEKRRAVALRYKKLLEGVESIVLPKEMTYARHVYHLFVIRVKSEEKSPPKAPASHRSGWDAPSAQDKREEIRNRLMHFLNDNGVATGLHYPVPLHLQNCFKYLGYKKGDFPVSEELAETGLSLPMFPEMTADQIEYVCSKIGEFFKK
jgi:dTDP-4-amino-4,6-dideoxygalactose transaminase